MMVARSRRRSVALTTLLLSLAPIVSHAWVASRKRGGASILSSTRLPAQRQVPSSLDISDDTSTRPEDPDDIDNRSIYSYPALYDLAFGYRDFEEEVAFLLQAHRNAMAAAPSSDHADNDNLLTVLELAAGPARHALQALHNDQHNVGSATCIDLSPDMKEYALKLYETQRPHDGDDNDAGASQRFHYHVQDMRSLDLSPSTLFDTAWVLLGSLQHLTTNADVLDCFRSVSKVLVPAGTLVVELPHPRELFGMVDCTRNEWTVPLSGSGDIAQEDDDDEDAQSDAGELEIIWGDEDDEFDPISQVRQATVMIQRNGGEDNQEHAALPRSIRQVVPMRLFTAQEVDLLAQCAGFKVVAMHGALQDGVDVNDEEEAFRMICVLQKQ